MKDESMVGDDRLTASRRGVLVGSLGVGLAAATGAILAATDGGLPHAHDKGRLAHGGAIHTDKWPKPSTHGGVAHSHGNLSHNHGITAHAVDEQTIRAVDIGSQPTT